MAEDLALAQRIVVAGGRPYLPLAEALIETRIYGSLSGRRRSARFFTRSVPA